VLETKPAAGRYASAAAEVRAHTPTRSERPHLPIHWWLAPIIYQYYLLSVTIVSIKEKFTPYDRLESFLSSSRSILDQTCMWHYLY
jgi:hypothetical protein